MYLEFAFFLPFPFCKAVANIERAIVKSLEKQYSDILTPLKDSIQKRLHLQVQKIARRQSATVHLVPNQVSSLYAFALGPDSKIQLNLSTQNFKLTQNFEA